MTGRAPAVIPVVVLMAILVAHEAWGQSFTYNPPGQLVDGSGEGRVDYTVYAPGIRFPVEVAPAYANSQVWGVGGIQGPSGSQCDARNYAYPWWDNYCESRSYDMPLCPAGSGHQGQDIRPSTCQDNTHWAVAVDDGTITFIGSYSVSLTTADGTTHRYLHMEPSSLVVSVNDVVSRGDRLGRISNAFGGSSTTIHLHYDIAMNVEGEGFVFVPPYLSLVESYEALIGGEDACQAIPPEGGMVDNQSPCFMLHGPLATWRYVNDAGYDGDLYWSYTWENEASNWAEWLVELERAGEYQVEVYVTPDYTQSQDTRYTVRHGDTQTEVRVNQSSGDGWLTVGTYEFAAGQPQNVAVYDGPGEALDLQRQFVADAVRFLPTGGVEPDDGSPDLGPPDTGAPDTEPPDAGAPDTSAPDAPPPPDTLAPETTEPDAGDDPEPDQASDVTVSSGCGCSASSQREPPGITAWWVLLGAAWVRGRSATSGRAGAPGRD